MLVLLYEEDSPGVVKQSEEAPVVTQRKSESLVQVVFNVSVLFGRK
jgi:hypothetical protein